MQPARVVACTSGHPSFELIPAATDRDRRRLEPETPTKLVIMRAFAFGCRPLGSMVICCRLHRWRNRFRRLLVLTDEHACVGGVAASPESSRWLILLGRVDSTAA